jgi:hypothetical protein
MRRLAAKLLQGSEDAHFLNVGICLRIHQDLVRKWIRLIRCYRRDVVAFPVDCVDYLEDGRLQLCFHLPAIPYCFWLASRRCQCDVDSPVLPDLLFVCFRNEPSFLSLLLEELHDEQATSSFRLVLRRLLRRRRIELTDEYVGALLNERLYLIF